MISVSPAVPVTVPGPVTVTVRSLLPGTTRTVTVSVSDFPAGSETVSVNVSSPCGAVNVGRCAVGLDSVTPAGAAQAYLTVSPSGSVPLPSSVTVSPSTAVWSSPAWAVGGSLSAATLTVAIAGSESSTVSLTVSEKVST